MNHHSPDDHQDADWPETTRTGDSADLEDSTPRRPGPILILVTMLIVLAMLATLIGPMLRSAPRRQPTPTPTPVYFQTA